jgi:GNAT superfamily N-acetyltransferase
MLVKIHPALFASTAKSRYQSSQRSAINPTDSEEGVDVSEAYGLRRATAADAAAARALTREAYAKWVPVIGREPKPMIADFDAAIRDHRVDLLCAGERIVALIETIAEPEALLIENVAVSPAWQGRGLGRRLMAHAEQLAGATGYGEIRLYTNARFVENIAFYQRIGYAIAREEPLLDGRVVHMSKRLGAA